MLHLLHPNQTAHLHWQDQTQFDRDCSQYVLLRQPVQVLLRFQIHLVNLLQQQSFL